MSKKVLIVEDESIVAYDLEMILIKAGYIVTDIAASVAEALECIEIKRPDIVLVDIFLRKELTGIDLAHKLMANNIAFIYLSANYQQSILEQVKTTHPYGFLVKPFRENELLIMMEVALYRHQHSLEAKIREEEVLENLFKNIVKEKKEWQQKLLKIARSIQPYLPFDFLTIAPDESEDHFLNGLMLLRTGYDHYDFARKDELEHGILIAPNKDQRQQDRKSGIFNGTDFYKLLSLHEPLKQISEKYRLRSAFYMPVLSDGCIYHVTFFSRKPDGYHFDQEKLFTRLNSSFIKAITSVAPADVLNGGSKVKDSMVQMEKKLTVFSDIVGDSHLMLRVLDHVTIAAPINTSVLILGESGTGKEIIARAIHQLSPRKEKPVVIINCASLPATLIESELFGHEKGAFTGAIERRKGKFELADKGTVFLDEIGEMPIELQAKLLRVLQEGEIERIGGYEKIKVDVRIIAATNRDLEKEVAAGRFRLDLYYRLCVFPINLPPLRERKEDIPNLAFHFLKKFSRRFNKNVTEISKNALELLIAHRWPGNIRELENVIARNILLSPDNVLILDTESFQMVPIELSITSSNINISRSADANSKDHILEALRKCNGRISGPGGAAEYLRLPPTTLHSKIKKLGLKKWD
ncbi:sigma 54-interacting transcriptional regulator [Mucilaginibacter sp. E4BP6]|uniref:sigma 54-interacting transcriptional regulator n=1 Tax=Mucilaginibacter sp. E4BP6 TaxID=2723089 RepID=UPI0015CE6906|nr:sigma 54-interacting transcriptional regulator [Mucilaginibacter sp. E4BP6]NYE67040.1 transcriptional regulator with GAF, ATPase, and Fis domain [Mucilaginibacter sp. E4BP6]